MVQCPSCARPQELRLVCQSCGSPLPVDLDCFAALGLPKKLTVDLPALESAYHELGRKIHPDRFASSPAKVRAASLAATALLTKSYRTIRDPISRGLYWLELNGEKLSENNKRVPPELAEMVFEVQEQLTELRDAAGDAAIELTNAVEARRHELATAMADLMRRLDRNFSEWDASSDNDRARLTAELKNILSRIAYLRTLIRDVNRGLESAKATGVTADN